jgi:hypothetical protein
VGALVTARWHAHRWHCGSWAAARCGRQVPLGPRGGAGQGGGRRGSPERLRGSEAGRGSVVVAVPVDGGTPVIGGGSGDVLQQGEAMGEVRRDPSHEEAACRWLSPWRGNPAARRREDGEGDGGLVARCEDEDEREKGEVWCLSDRRRREMGGGGGRGMAALG